MEGVSKSWFCVFNNPEEHGYDGEPFEVVEKIIDVWMEENPQRTCAVTYCISIEGLKHCHAVFEDTKAMRFTAVKKLYPSMHIEPTKGNKEQAEDYINKKGKWEEKGEIIVFTGRRGEIKGSQGQRRDLSIIEELLEQGKTPLEIMNMSLSYRRYEKMVRDAYYQKRASETPIKREIKTYWHVGESGTGKSYTILEIAEKRGENSLYLLSDYHHGFDKYNGEPILFMDEFRSQIQFAQLLVILDGYKVQVPCRYSNIYALWSEVHITSVIPPEFAYRDMVEKYQKFDTYEQLRRRINFVVYHWIDEDGKYRSYEMPMSQYVDYASLKSIAEEQEPALGVF